MSLIPERAIFSVLGMGVADRVSTSALLQRDFSFSFWATPNRCSSSIITSPRSLNLTSLLTSLWVPTTMSTAPRFRRFKVSSCCLGLLNRDKSSTSTGKPSMRLKMV